MNANKLIPSALYSVTDKTGLLPLAETLWTRANRVPISTGGTGDHLSSGGLSVVPIQEGTGVPEMMGGLVKTINPRVSASVMHFRDNDAHVQAVLDCGMKYDIDFVVFNLYDFEGHKDEEHIDIGGVLNLRQAAKRWRWVTIVSHPSQYDEVISEVSRHGKTSLSLRHCLAMQAFQATSEYDLLIAKWFLSQEGAVRAEQERGDIPNF